MTENSVQPEVEEVSKPDIDPKTWNEFISAGLLWWINRQLQLFGWALVAHYDVDDKGNKSLKLIYPARCRFRGYTREINDINWVNLTSYLAQHARELLGDVVLTEKPAETEKGEPAGDVGDKSVDVYRIDGACSCPSCGQQFPPVEPKHANMATMVKCTCGVLVRTLPPGAM